MIRTLNRVDVLSIHEVLAQEAAGTDDAISPSGVKSDHLLESAISRQHTGFDGRMKYSSPEQNAATLCYGICCDHPFHNGNKRTALVAMLCHLDRNDRTFFPNLSQDALYDFMVKIAGHNLGAKGKQRDKSDEEVDIIASWLRRNTRRIQRGERLVTHRQLRTVLQAHGFTLENLADNAIDVVKYTERSEWFGIRKTKERQRYIRVGWPREGATVSKGQLRKIRSACGLTEDDGVDSTAFYAAEQPVDFFVMTYKATLRRLAKT